MSGKPSLSAIVELPVEEKLRLLEAVWDSIADSPDALPLTDEQRRELDARYEQYLQAPDDGASWHDVRQRINKSS